jgi:hypothetical protein
VAWYYDNSGSNLAATLVNAILTYDDAAQLRAGRDV